MFGFPLWTNVWREEVTPQDCASTITIVEAIGTFVVAVAALLVSVAALRTQCQALRAQREALPVSVEFSFKKSGFVDRGGVRWVMAWMQNRGVTVYVRELYRYEWEPLFLREEQLPDVARAGESGSMPEFLRSKSKRELRENAGVFEPGKLPPGQYSMFYVSCPPGVERVKLAVTVSVKRQGEVRFISSEWFEVPSAEELIVSYRETRAYLEQQARGPEGPTVPAEGAED